jgi:hypothetical protein
VAGNLTGAAAFGALLGLAGGLAPWHDRPSMVVTISLLAAGAVALAYSLGELKLIPVAYPQLRRQVRSTWRFRLPPTVTALVYGLELGTGVTTFVSVGSFYVVALWVMLVGNAGLGAVLLAFFGLGRALPVIWFGLGQRAIEDTFAIVEPVTRFGDLVHLLNGFVLGLMGAGLLVAGLWNL